MIPSPANPARFMPCRERLATTLTRTILIALVVASVLTVVRLRHVPSSMAESRFALALLVSVAWISVGGHWVELFYLNVLRPRRAHWPDASLALLRLTVWLIGGTILALAAITTHSLVATAHPPRPPQLITALKFGGPLFVGVELIVHTLLALKGRPSFWNRRG